MRRLFILSALVMFTAVSVGCQLCPKSWRRPTQGAPCAPAQGAPCGCETTPSYGATMYPDPGTMMVVPGTTTTTTNLPGPTMSPVPTS
jgi:hypothetical protein